jgi:hypothetical protein
MMNSRLSQWKHEGGQGRSSIDNTFTQKNPADGSAGLLESLKRW